MGSDENHFNVSVGSDGQSHETVVHKPQPFWRERRAEAVSNRGPSAYQPNALPLGQTGSPMVMMTMSTFIAHDSINVNAHCAERVVGWGVGYGVRGVGVEGNRPKKKKKRRCCGYLCNLLALCILDIEPADCSQVKVESDRIGSRRIRSGHVTSRQDMPSQMNSNQIKSCQPNQDALRRKKPSGTF